ncbi:MAG: hypothetical protein E7642_08185 [Ruminococcaceae bacterium]|nr:hypothetical protein [Oscillospiraceae bacterium]
MKRLLATILALVFVCTGILALSSCSAPEPAPVPEGYKEYNNGDISFSYPEAWITTDGSVVTITESAAGGNNVTVAYEAQNDDYKTMTKEKYEELVKPSLDTMGMAVSNVVIDQTSNEYIKEITKITQTISVSGVSMSQTLYMFDSNDRTYTVTVTEVKKDATLVKNVFDTLVALK